MNLRPLSSQTPRLHNAFARTLTFVSHYGSTAFAQFVTLGLGILSGILSARILGPVGRGEYTAIVIWPMGLATVLAFGVNQAIVYYSGQATFTRSEITTSVAFVGLVQGALCLVLGFIIVPLVLSRYSSTVQRLGILFLTFTPVLLLSGYPSNLLQGAQDLLRFNLTRILAPIVYAIGLLILLLWHVASLQLVIFVQLLGYIVALTAGSWIVCRVLKIRFHWNPNVIPKLLGYGTRIQGLSIATYVNQRIDQLILSLLVPPRQLGFYAVAVALSGTVAVFPQAAGIVAFSKGSAQDPEEARATIRLAFRSSLIWLLVSCAILFAIAPVLIRLVFGEAFDGSILACRILLAGALMTGLNFVLYNAASALGRPGLSSIAEGFSVGITAIGLLLLVPRYGYVGAAIVSSVAYSTSFLLMLALADRALGLSLRDLTLGGR